MRASLLAVLYLGGALALVACGGGEQKSSIPSPPPKADVPLAAGSRLPGEIVLNGEASPREHGPIAFNGRYRVRFQQSAPEDPSIDFGTETPFVARVVKPGEHAPGRRLFRSASGSGERTLTLDGRFLVSVEFGDWPYAIRFTPAG
jgi:hypothetical protein